MVCHSEERSDEESHTQWSLNMDLTVYEILRQPGGLPQDDMDRDNK